MIVNVKFIGSFRSLSGKDKLALRFEDSLPLRKVIREMVGELPKLEEALIDRELDEPKTSMLILVDGKEISVLNGLDTVIRDGDEVVFVPVLHGG
jgi:molybdopterin synthase sulfur carrier subunit